MDQASGRLPERCSTPASAFYSVLYFLLIIGFSYFYATIQFNPIEVANNLKKNGGFIPGFRPGKPTADFISKVLNKITMFGALYLCCDRHRCPSSPANLMRYHSSLAIGGTSVIIVVGVALETVQAAGGSDDDAPLQGLPGVTEDGDHRYEADPAGRPRRRQGHPG